MFAPALIVAQAKIDELHAEAAANRLAKKNHRGPGRIAGAAHEGDRGGFRRRVRLSRH